MSKTLQSCKQKITEKLPHFHISSCEFANIARVLTETESKFHFECHFQFFFVKRYFFTNH